MFVWYVWFLKNIYIKKDFVFMLKNTFFTRLWSFAYLILFFELFNYILKEFLHIDSPILMGLIFMIVIHVMGFEKRYSEFVLNYAMFRSTFYTFVEAANEGQRQREEEEILERLFFRQHRHQDPRDPRRAPRPEPGFGRRDDNQNVHDSQILSTIKLSIQKLRKETKIVKDEAETIKEVRRLAMVKENPKDGFIMVDINHKATKSLDDIEKNTEFIESVDCGEVEALVLVWNRILQHPSEKQRDLKDILLYQLTSMQTKNNTSYCATGRIARLIDTLNIVDPKVKIVPFYAINEEMMNKSSKIRDTMLGEYQEKEKSEFESGTSVTQEAFDSLLKETILKELRKDYVLTGILTEEKFTNETNKWIDCI
jgi:hypothetical protein